MSWTPRADEAVANSTAAAHAGTHSLLATGRTRTWEGPTLNVLSTMQKGTRYTLSVWIRLAANEASTQARLSVERRLAGVANYDQVVGNTNVSNGGWTQLTGGYTLANDADRLTRQADRYKALFDVYRKYRANLASVTLWGIADDDTWLDTFPVARKDAPLLLDVALQAKPAYWSVIGTTSPSPSPTATPSRTVTPSPTATPSPTSSTPQPAGACRITYTIINQWPDSAPCGRIALTLPARSAPLAEPTHSDAGRFVTRCSPCNR